MMSEAHEDYTQPNKDRVNKPTKSEMQYDIRLPKHNNTHWFSHTVVPQLGVAGLVL